MGWSVEEEAMGISGGGGWFAVRSEKSGGGRRGRGRGRGRGKQCGIMKKGIEIVHDDDACGGNRVSE